MLRELTSDVVDSILRQQYFGRIACAADGQVLIEPITYLFDGYYIYGQTREGTKIQMLRKNPAVCFEVDEMVAPDIWRSVVVQGTYEELEGDERLAVEQRLGVRTPPLYPHETPQYNNGKDTTAYTAPPKRVVYRIRIATKTGRSVTRNE
ncbi:hypothetical protein GCM10023189_05480 [Nibrella saemangeumensis]|uniref:Pyridoxamine 5'-phosphate oxidase n=1 Tax=Nibrella saemangeumensis TaxID=1084526 RepID=A0ABP8MEG7_9BACT